MPENARPSFPPMPPRAPERAAPVMPTRPPVRPPEMRPADPVNEYAKRSAHQGLDPHGRAAPVHNSVEEDQLDIPAFLRRQAT